VTVVNGAQGYGKSTQVASWLEGQPSSVLPIWINCVPGIDGLERFGAQLTAAIDRQHNWHGIRSAAAANANADAGVYCAADPFRALRILLDAVPSGCRVVLVLDDAQRVHDPELLTALVDLVRQNRHFHLIASARGEHPLLALAASAGGLARITPADLLLSVSEIGELAAVMRVRLGAGDAERLHDLLGGWMVPLRLVIEEIGEGADRLPAERAREYVRGVALKGVQDQDALAEMMRFSLAKRLTRRLIKEVSDAPEPEMSISMIESSGLADIRYREDEVYLVFPTIVRDVLRDACTVRDPQGALQMHARLADWYTVQGGDENMLMAFQHAAAGRDWARLDRLWNAREIALGLRFPAQVAAVLRELPERVIASRHGMRVALATDTVAASGLDTDADGRIATLRAYVEASSAVVAAHLNELTLPDLLFVGAGHIAGQRMVGHFDLAARTSARLERRAAILMANGAAPGGWRAWFDLQRGLTWTLIGDHDAAVTCYELSWQRGLGAAPHIRSNAAANLALSYALRGDRVHAERWLQRHRSFDTRGEWSDLVIGIGARIASGILALDRLDLETCKTELEHLGDGCAPFELWPFIAYLNAQYGLQVGDPATALAALERTRRAHLPILSDHGAAATLLTAAAVDLLIASGQAQRASQLLDRAGNPGTAGLAAPRARISLLAGDYGATRVTTVMALRDESITDRERLDLLLLKATAALRMGDTDHGQTRMRQALELVSRAGILRPLTSLSSAELGILGALADSGLAPGLLDRVRAHRQHNRRCNPDGGRVAE